jgi:hypothetical protein
MINRKYARARPRHTAGTMNKTEAEYYEKLKLMKLSGEIIDYRFEALKLNLADRCTYTPDFLVINKNYEIELHEVKGFWEDDARVKIKVAAEQYPWFKIIAVKKNAKKDGGGWKIEEF